MRTARLDFKPHMVGLSLERPKTTEPVPEGVEVQVITTIPQRVEPWVRHLADLRRILSQQEIARQAGLTSSHLSRYCAQTHAPNAANAEKLRILWEELCS